MGIKFIAIHRWMNKVKIQKEAVIKKDHKWLFTKILHVQASHLDSDGSGDVDKKEFVDYFVTKIGFDEQLANDIFNDIDVNGDGDLSIMEYTKWKNKHNKPDKLKKYFEKKKPKKPTPKSYDADDIKCEQCKLLKRNLNESRQQIKELNNTYNISYNQIELKLKSVQSKHTNLLQDYTKLSELLDEEKNKSNASSMKDMADKLAKGTIDSLEKKNKKLLEMT